jgi:hypothetical protein
VCTGDFAASFLTSAFTSHAPSTMANADPPLNPFRTNADARLCKRCQSMFTSAKLNGGEHYDNVTDFMAAVRQGCYFCTMAWIQHLNYSESPIHDVTYVLDRQNVLPSASHYEIAILCMSAPGICTTWCGFRGSKIEQDGEYTFELSIRPLIATFRSAPVFAPRTAHIGPICKKSEQFAGSQDLASQLHFRTPRMPPEETHKAANATRPGQPEPPVF